MKPKPDIKKAIEELKDLNEQIELVNKSIYFWENRIENAHEIRLNIKTHKKYISEVIQIIKKNHNYEVPEIVTSQFDINDDNYKKWFDNNLRREI